MPDTTTKVRMGGKTAVAMARHPTLRKATMQAGKPPAKVGWRVGKAVAKRKARTQADRVVTAGRTAGSLALIYGPMAAEVFGLIETPTPKRRAPAFLAGVVIGAGALYAFNRSKSG